MRSVKAVHRCLRRRRRHYSQHCIDPECPVHHPSRVVPFDPEAEARRKQHEKEQTRRRRLEKDRAETFNRILENVPATFTTPQLRVVLGAFITCDLYGQSDVVATHYAGEDDDNNQSSEEILLSVSDRLEEVQLPELALRLALCSHIRIPHENEIDHLAEIEKVFAPKQAKKRTAKKAVRKPTPAKGKTAKKKATKRIAV